MHREKRPTALQLRLLRLLADGYRTDAILKELGYAHTSLYRLKGRMRDTLVAETDCHAVAIAFKRGLLS